MHAHYNVYCTTVESCCCDHQSHHASETAAALVLLAHADHAQCGVQVFERVVFERLQGSVRYDNRAVKPRNLVLIFGPMWLKNPHQLTCIKPS